MITYPCARVANRFALLASALTAMVATLAFGGESPVAPKPVFQKKSTLACAIVETTPFMFRGKAYRFEWPDIDFCEFNGRLVINYSWGNQNGTEFLAEAEYAGTQISFLTGWFLEASMPTRKP